MKEPILSICIPTYNRAKDLDYNLSLISSYIQKDNLFDSVQIVISNNCSPDHTKDIIQKWVGLCKMHIEYYEQKRNIGAGPNLVYVVEQARTPWVLLLGDDDYLEPWYISGCLKQIEEHPELGCIIPNYIAYYPDTNTFGNLREKNCPTEYYDKGFKTCCENSWRAHQLSGLCFRREGVVSSYHKNKMDNLYPQIFFVSYNILRYDVLHYGQKCLAVSGVPQSQKDWDYRDDGLVDDIFENYMHLGLSPLKRAVLEAYHLKKDMRYLWATSNTNLTVEKILDCENVSRLGRILIAFRISRRKCYTGTKHKALFKMLDCINSIVNMFSSKHK